MTCTITPSASAESKHYDEYSIKTAFIYNFINFITWPGKEDSSEDNEPIYIGILGNSPFGNSIDVLNSKKAKNRQIIVVEFKGIDESGKDDKDSDLMLSDLIGELRKCRILFICPSEERYIPKIVKALENVPVLTIGESKNFTEAGGMIQFVIVDKKVNFVINLSSARKANLQISSKILKLALKVIKEEKES
jgi:hypothetical protein